MHKEYSVFEQKEKGRRTMGKKEKNEKKVGFGKCLPGTAGQYHRESD